MREGTIVFFVFLFLLVSGTGFYFFGDITSKGDFNFYKSEISIQGLHVNEKLSYHTDEKYHTLYRNFVDPIYSGVDSSSPNSIFVSSVSCSSGSPYVYTKYDGCFDGAKKQIKCMSHTKNNEYGCSFGDVYGFSSKKDYSVSSNYKIHPNKIFVVDGKNYAKFVLYSESNHYPLNLGETLFVSGEGVVYDKSYSSKDNVILYVPISEEDKAQFSQLEVVYLDDFEFDSSRGNPFMILLFLFPGVLFVFSWFFFGRENHYTTPPDYLSVYPVKRKPWEVAAFFNIPLGTPDSRFFSALLINLFYNKVFLIRQKGKDILMKLNSNYKYELDNVEQKFIEIFNYVFEKASDRYKEDGFLNLKKASLAVSRTFFDSSGLRVLGLDMKRLLSKESKNYVNSIGIILSVVVIFGYTFLMVAFFRDSMGIIFFSIFSCIVFFISSFLTMIFRKYRGKYYEEYLNWKAFKKFLNSSSLRYHGHKGVIIWEEYLMYGAALGISKKVIKELRQRGLISDEYYQVHVGTVSMSTSISQSGASGSSGHSGAGGGGVGGGGGGGR